MQVMTSALPAPRVNKSSLVFGADLGAAFRIRDAGTDIVVVRRTLSKSLRTSAQRLCAAGPAFRHECKFDSQTLHLGDFSGLSDVVPEGPLLERIRVDALALSRTWSQLTDRRHGRATLLTIDTDYCGKFHSDSMDLRILCTYRGPGTWLAPEHALDRSAIGHDDGTEANAKICPKSELLVQAAAGEVVLLKGSDWAEDAHGAVHRSPTIQGSGQVRLVLKVDGLGCGC